ncbi:MAG: competence/damage-inducible protein A [Defluviitaleaceae bacterium]|nr:competence/damage-inducible protein A [Defluviitaleaceae bacterium]
MSSEILAIGTEILLGDTLNTNAHFLSQELAGLGISVYHHSTVGDNYKRVKDAMELALGRSDILITTGGLGPTMDDITVQVAADVMGRDVVFHKESLDRIVDFFTKRDILATEDAKAQAQIVEGAKVLVNTNGLAPGSIIEEKGKTLIILPGPPEELKNMWISLVPYLKNRSGQCIVSKTINMGGIGESSAEYALKDLITTQKNPTIAPYAKSGGGVAFRITANAATEEEAHALIVPLKNELYARLGKHIFGEDNITLEEAVINALLENKLTVAVAESITGGMVISRLINVAGASNAVIEGIVAYTNSSKVNRGLVKQETLDKYGAISEETATEMAKNIANISGASIGISTTGFAQTQTENQGIAYISVAMGDYVKTIKHTTLGNRARVRSQVATNLLETLRKEINTWQKKTQKTQ